VCDSDRAEGQGTRLDSSGALSMGRRASWRGSCGGWLSWAEPRGRIFPTPEAESDAERHEL